MTYRGSARLWSNRYHFDGSKPADNTKWTTFADAVTAAEKAIWQNSVGFQIVEALGYDAGSDVPVFTKTYALNGSHAAYTNYTMQPGDVAAMVRYSTADRTAKNHPLYLYNWYHFVLGGTAQPVDELHDTMQTAIGTYAAAWITGFSDGAVTHHRCGPNGNLATGYVVNEYLRHRDFPAG